MHDLPHQYYQLTPIMPGLRHYQTRGLVENLLLVRSMSALDAKLVSQLAALLEGTIGVALHHS
jgi:hypothetical protein